MEIKLAAEIACILHEELRLDDPKLENIAQKTRTFFALRALLYAMEGQISRESPSKSLDEFIAVRDKALADAEEWVGLSNKGAVTGDNKEVEWYYTVIKRRYSKET